MHLVCLWVHCEDRVRRLDQHTESIVLRVRAACNSQQLLHSPQKRVLLMVPI